MRSCLIFSFLFASFAAVSQDEVVTVGGICNKSPVGLNAMVIGDTLNLSYHRILNPFDTVRQKVGGRPDSCFIDLNNDGTNDFLFLAKGDLEGIMGGNERYFTITPFDSNEVIIDRIDTTHCIYYATRPVVRSYAMHDTLNAQAWGCFRKTYIDYYLWIMDATCSVHFGDFNEKFIGVRMNSPGSEGLGWIRVCSYDDGFYYGYVGVIKEYAFRSRTSSVPEPVPTDLTLYPNPASGRVSLQVPARVLPCSLSVFTSLGVKIMDEVLVSERNTLNLQKGMYLVRVISGDQKVSIRKLIIE